jgi:hypothetical protein
MAPSKKQRRRRSFQKPSRPRSVEQPKATPASLPGNRPSRDQSKTARRQVNSPKKPKNPPSVKSRFQKLSSSLVWQGITGILTLVSVVVAIVSAVIASNAQEHAQTLEKQNAMANMTLATTYMYDGSDKWTMFIDVYNNGPAVANVVHLGYSAPTKICFVTKTIIEDHKKVTIRGLQQSLGCPGGSLLTSVTPTKSAAGRFIHPLASYSIDSTHGLFSGTAYNMYRGEDIWISFNFTATPELNRELVAEISSEHFTLPLSSPTKLGILFSSFSQVTVTGDNVNMTGSRYEASDIAPLSLP